ncbi:MAG: extracellular solute-binding protein family 1 [Paenibacillus sp.]|nr:extracellular solute-binding protein family 1 [Paenibacillus sp.]
MKLEMTVRRSPLVICTGLALMMTACSSDSAHSPNPTAFNTADSGTAQPAAVENPLLKDVELTIVSGSPDDEMNAVYLDPLRKKFPNVRIKNIQMSAANHTTLPELLSSKVKFDLFTTSRGGYETNILDYQLKYDMTELIRKHHVDISNLEPTAMDSMRQMGGGKLYGLPVRMNSLLLFYNKALFDKFGVPYPKDGMTWNETFDLAKRMTRTDGQKYYGLGSSSTAAYLGWNPLSLPLVNTSTKKPTINTDERWKTLIQTVFLNSTITDSYKDAGKIPDWAAFSKTQNVAMILYTAAVPLALTKDLEPLDWDMVSLPVFADAPKLGSQTSPNYFGVTSLSTNPDAAIEAIKYWTSLEYLVEGSKGGSLMASRAKEVTSVLGKGSPFPNKNWGAVTYFPFAPMSATTNVDTKVRSVYEKYLNATMAGTMDLNTALRTMDEEAQKIITAELTP